MKNLVVRIKLVWSTVVASEPPCEGKSLVVNCMTATSEYEMSLITTRAYGGACPPVQPYDIRKALKGCDKMLSLNCKKAMDYSLTITPKMDCDWKVLYLYFKVKNVKKVEVYVDDKKVYSVCVAFRANSIYYRPCSYIGQTRTEIMEIPYGTILDSVA